MDTLFFVEYIFDIRPLVLVHGRLTQQAVQEPKPQQMANIINSKCVHSTKWKTSHMLGHKSFYKNLPESTACFTFSNPDIFL